MKTFTYASILMATILVMEACGSHGSEQQAIVEEWIGKEIVIPQGLTFQIQDTPIDYNFDNADFKIVTYIDSTGCTNCKMKLREWDRLINEFKSDPDVDVEFLMVVNSGDNKEVINLLRENNFQHVVSFDSSGEYDKSNQLPTKSQFQTFLLNSENEVLALGNPVTNPKIKDLYKRIIFDESEKASDMEELSVLCDNPVRALGVVNKGDTIRRMFRLTNERFDNLTLQDIVASCYCIKGNATFTSISKGNYADISVEYVADTVAHPVYQYLEVYFKESEKPVRLILHGYANVRKIVVNTD